VNVIPPEILHIYIRTAIKDDRLLFEVIDDGKGMTAE